MLALVIVASLCAQEAADAARPESLNVASTDAHPIGFGIHAGGFVGPFRGGSSLLPQAGVSASFNPMPALRLRGHIEGLPLPALGVVQSGIGIAWTPAITSWLQPVIGADVRAALTTGQNDTLAVFVDESSLGASLVLGLDVRPLPWFAIQPFVEVPYYPSIRPIFLPCFNLGFSVFPAM